MHFTIYCHINEIRIYEDGHQKYDDPAYFNPSDWHEIRYEFGRIEYWVSGNRLVYTSAKQPFGSYFIQSNPYETQSIGKVEYICEPVTLSLNVENYLFG